MTSTSRIMQTGQPQPALIEGLRKISECEICMDLYLDLRSLPSIHTFCRKCLHRLLKNSSSNCPVCRQDFQLPPSGMFPKNCFVEKVVDAVKVCLSNNAQNDKPFACHICELPIATQLPPSERSRTVVKYCGTL